MLEVERFDKILSELRIRERISYQELENIVEVSPSTIRRDVEKMHQKRMLVKIKGGISLVKKMNYDLEVNDRFKENISEKEEIARKTVKLVKDGDFIYLDAGTTVFHFIEYLRDKEITVVTNGYMHIDELMKNKIKTIMVGGEIKETTGAIVGIEAVESIGKYRFDKCFVGTNGITLESGFTTPELNEALLKKKVLELSDEKYILADSTKFEKTSNIQFSILENCKIISSNKAIKENNRYKKYFLNNE